MEDRTAQLLGSPPGPPLLRVELACTGYCGTWCWGIGSRIEFLLIPLVFGLGAAMTTVGITIATSLKLGAWRGQV